MANRFFRNTGNTAWNTATNWSATDGGASVGAVPTSADDIFFTSNSGNCVLTGTAGVGLSLTCTGFTGSLTISTTLTISTNITFSGSMTLAGTSAITVTGTGTITSGVTIPILQNQNGTISFSGTVNITTLNLLGATATFAGATGFNATNVTITAASVVCTFVNSVTYNINNLTSITSTGGSHASIKSNLPGTKTILAITGVINCGYTDFTDVNATIRKIGVFSSTVATCTNVTSVTDQPTFSLANSIFQ